MRHWAKSGLRKRATTFYDPVLIVPESLDLRFTPGMVIEQEVPISTLRKMFPLRVRSPRFVSHAPRGPIHKRASRRLSMFYVENLPLPQIPPDVFDVPKRWHELAEQITGAPGVIWPKRSETP